MPINASTTAGGKDLPKERNSKNDLSRSNNMHPLMQSADSFDLPPPPDLPPPDLPGPGALLWILSEENNHDFGSI